MASIGEYKDRIVILTRTLAPASDDPNGEAVESWPNPATGTGEHWARIESPGGAEELGPPRRRTRTAILRFRTLVPLAAVDRVRLKEVGDVYNVTGVWRERAENNGWQTVCSLFGTY